MFKNFSGKLLKFANHLAADYYGRDQKSSAQNVNKKNQKKGASLHDETSESFKEEANKPA